MNNNVDSFASQAARVLREDGCAMTSQLIIGWGELHGMSRRDMQALADMALDVALPDSPSYITVDIAKNKAVAEDFQKRFAAHRLGKGHLVLPAMEYMQRFNKGEFRGNPQTAHA